MRISNVNNLNEVYVVCCWANVMKTKLLLKNSQICANECVVYHFIELNLFRCGMYHSIVNMYSLQYIQHPVYKIHAQAHILCCHLDPLHLTLSLSIPLSRSPVRLLSFSRALSIPFKDEQRISAINIFQFGIYTIVRYYSLRISQ